MTERTKEGCSFVRKSRSRKGGKSDVSIPRANQLLDPQEPAQEPLSGGSYGAPEEHSEDALGVTQPRQWPKVRRNRRQTKLAVMGIPSDTLNDPEWRRCVKLSQSYRNVRVREFHASHGFVSAGVSALLATSALALASSRYLYEKALDGGPDEVGTKLQLASKLADSSRQNELAAWELCAKEAKQRKATSSANAGVPWLVSQNENTSATSSAKRGRGRPRKDDIVLDTLAADMTRLLTSVSESEDGDAGNIREAESSSKGCGSEDSGHTEPGEAVGTEDGTGEDQHNPSEAG